MPQNDNEIALERHSPTDIDKATSYNPFACSASLDTENVEIEEECAVEASSTIAKGKASSYLSHQSLTAPPASIQNTSLLYVPIKLRCGVTAQCQPNVFVHCRQVLTYLNADVTQCLHVLPPSVHALVKRTTIWINMEYSYGTVSNPKRIKHITTHHHAAWLIAVAHDKPQKTMSVEIYSAAEYCRNRLQYNGSGLLLHEYCHLIHQLVLPNGLENETVVLMYSRMKRSGRYDRVFRRDWAGLEVERDMHYCVVNHKEMWAELSVAYLAEGYRDIATTPNRASATMNELSPPFMSPDVLERVKKAEMRSPFLVKNYDPIFKCIRTLMGHEDAVPHCNKFYPFTSRQFAVHDPELYNEISLLWTEISDWEDSVCNKKCWECPGACKYCM